jgi:phage replication O-like protein O
MKTTDRFVRVPTDLLEALLRKRLSGGQWSIIFWIIRQTFGWNRPTTSYSWYRIAVELAMDRGGVVRAGRQMLRRKILYLEGSDIGVAHPGIIRHRTATMRSGSMTNVSDDESHRKPMTGIIANDDRRHRNRCQKSPVSRRAKDSTKDNLKTKRKSVLSSKRKRRGTDNQALGPHHPAGAARPVPGKYDDLSKDR